VFEYIGPDNRIVLRYDEPMLVLLAMRETVSGQFIPFSGLNRWGREYGIPVVSCRDIGSACTAEEFVKYTRELKGEEGFVVYFDDGYMVKVKAEDYVLKHRALDDLGSKKKVVALCCQGFADDVLPILGDADKEELIAFDRALKAEISRLVHIAHGLVYPVVQGVISRKDFALSPVQNVRPSWLRGVCFGILDGKNAQRLVLQAVEKGGYADIGVKWRGE
jgi:RNA ligase